MSVRPYTYDYYELAPRRTVEVSPKTAGSIVLRVKASYVICKSSCLHLSIVDYYKVSHPPRYLFLLSRSESTLAGDVRLHYKLSDFPIVPSVYSTILLNQVLRCPSSLVARTMLNIHGLSTCLWDYLIRKSGTIHTMTSGAWRDITVLFHNVAVASPILAYIISSNSEAWLSGITNFGSEVWFWMGFWCYGIGSLLRKKYLECYSISDSRRFSNLLNLCIYHF